MGGNHHPEANTQEFSKPEAKGREISKPEANRREISPPEAKGGIKFHQEAQGREL